MVSTLSLSEPSRRTFLLLAVLGKHDGNLSGVANLQKKNLEI
jgi:hypothetical protein